MVASGLTFPSPAQPTESESNLDQGLEKVSSKVISASRDSHSQTWQRVETLREADGNLVTQTNVAYVQVETGLHYRSSDQWLETREVIEPVAGGAVAAQGPHKVIFAENLNTLGAIDLDMPDGKRLRSQVLGLAYLDRASGKTVLIAEIKDSYGRIVNSNQVTYPDAFSGVKADVRYTYLKAGLEQDIILREQPPKPEDYQLEPKTTVLQVLTEFVNAPTPEVREATLAGALDGIHDQYLDFGTMQIVPGTAFLMDTNQTGIKGIKVAKSWLRVDDRNILVESLPLAHASAQLETLPARKRTAFFWRRNAKQQLASQQLKLPPRARQQPSPRKMLLAQAADLRPGFVVDYLIVSSQPGYTFRADTTYYVSGTVNLSGAAAIEGGTVIKFAPPTSARLNINGDLICKTGPYRPAIFTARDDDSVGDMITGSTHNPNSIMHYGGGIYYGGHFPPTPNPVLNYLHFRHLLTGLILGWDDAQWFTVANGQFVKCQTAIQLAGSVRLQNCLLAQIGAAFIGESETAWHGEHLTVDQCTYLTDSYKPSLYLTNSLLVNITALEGPAVVLADWYLDSTAPVLSGGGYFQTAGAGNYYLAESSPYRDAGTPDIDPELLAALAKKTTFPPPSGNILENQTLVNGTSWSPTGIQDTSNPDLGYHYDPLDYCVASATISGTLNVQAGTAIGFFGAYGFRYGTLKLDGTPLDRVQVAHYSAVQEQPLTWSATAVSSYLLKTGAKPTLTWRFADVSNTGGARFGYGTAQSLDIRHCHLYGCRMGSDGGYGHIQGFTNNILERCDFQFGLCSGSAYSMKFGNNLFLNSSLGVGHFCNAALVGSLAVHNNLFSGSSFTHGYAPGYYPQISHNGYHNNTYVTSLGTNPKTLTATPDFQVGPLGSYYYPTTGGNLSQLIDAGSTTAEALGLCPFTVQSDEQWDGYSQVDIGYHYPATSSSLPYAYPQTLPPVCPDDANPLLITLYGGGYNCTPLVFQIVRPPSHGTLSAVTPIDYTSASVTYTPHDPEFCGEDSFDFKVANELKDSDPATVTIVIGDPDSLVANCSDAVGKLNTPVTFTLTGSKGCGGELTFNQESAPNNGTITSFDPETGEVTYEPNPDFLGSDFFYFSVSACGFDSSWQLAYITVVQPPLLVASCGPDSILLRWFVSPAMENSGLITDFVIKRATTPGGPYTIIHTSPDNTKRTFTDDTVTPGVTYCYVVVLRVYASCTGLPIEGPPSDEVCLSTCTPPCEAPVISGWFFTDEGIVGPNNNLSGAFRQYTDPTSVPASPWSFPSSAQCITPLSGGLLLRMNFENDNNCTDQHDPPNNPNIQKATADAVISLSCQRRLRVNWCGIGERHQPLYYELMTLHIDGQLVADAHAPGDLGTYCDAGMGPTVPRSGTPQPPQEIVLNPGFHALKISTDTGDGQYHWDAFYEFEFTFLEP